MVCQGHVRRTAAVYLHWPEIQARWIRSEQEGRVNAGPTHGNGERRVRAVADKGNPASDTPGNGGRKHHVECGTSTRSNCQRKSKASDPKALPGNIGA